MVAADAITTIVNSPDPEEACAALIAMANTAGGTDNATVLLLEIT